MVGRGAANLGCRGAGGGGGRKDTVVLNVLHEIEKNLVARGGTPTPRSVKVSG